MILHHFESVRRMIVSHEILELKKKIKLNDNYVDNSEHYPLPM